METSAGRKVRRLNFARCARAGSSWSRDFSLSQADCGWDVGEVLQCELGATYPSRSPHGGGGAGGQWVLRMVLLHVVEFLVELEIMMQRYKKS